jgi:hypothetical protein
VPRSSNLPGFDLRCSSKLTERFHLSLRLNGAASSSSSSSSKKQAGYCEASLARSPPNDVLGAGVVATSGEVTVSSDHLLCEGDELSAGEFDADIVERAFDLAVELDSIRKGIRRVPQNVVKLSFRLRTDPDKLSFRGLYDGSGCGCDGMKTTLLAGTGPGGVCGSSDTLGLLGLLGCGCEGTWVILLVGRESYGIGGLLAVSLLEAASCLVAGNNLYVGLFSSFTGAWGWGMESWL